MNKTKIEWADMTFNPVTGCFHKCDYCYAYQIARRFGGASETHNNECVMECMWLTEAEGKIHYLKEPIQDYDRCRYAPYPFEFDPTFHAYRLDEPQTIHNPKNIFVCSMADLFGNWVPDKWIKQVFEACKKAPQHRYLFLTKNSRRYQQLYEKNIMPSDKDNLWFGGTITSPDDMFFFSEEIGYNGFLSIEPILSEFNTDKALPECIKWIIIGAETGTRKNKVIPQKSWIDNICKVADMTGAKVFMKDSLLPIVGEENMRREFPWGNC